MDIVHWVIFAIRRIPKIWISRKEDRGRVNCQPAFGIEKWLTIISIASFDMTDSLDPLSLGLSSLRKAPIWASVILTELLQRMLLLRTRWYWEVPYIYASPLAPTVDYWTEEHQNNRMSWARTRHSSVCDANTVNGLGARRVQILSGSKKYIPS